MTATDAARPAGWMLVGGATALVVAMVIAVVAAAGADHTGLQSAVRATARSSALLFLAAFLTAPLRALRRNGATAWLVRNLPYTTLSFVASHALHLALVAAYLRAGGTAPEPAAAAAGGLGYGFVAAIAATSSDRSAAWLGPRRWRRLQLFGLYYLWGVFAVFFTGAAADGRPDAPVFAALFALALAARLWLLRRGRGVRDGAVG